MADLSIAPSAHTVRNFLTTLTEAQRAELAALMGFPGTIHHLQRLLVPETATKQAYIDRLRTLLNDRNWPLEDIDRIIACESGVAA